MKGDTHTDVSVSDTREDDSLPTTYRPQPGTFYGLDWRYVRRAAFAVYFGALAWWIATHEVPTARAALALIIMTGLLLTSIGSGWRAAWQVFRDWFPFTAVLLLYDQTRGVADELGITLHESDVLHVEKWMFGGAEPTLWLQHHLYNPAHVYWYDAVCTLVYTSHFLATPILAAILWLRDRALWLRYITRVIVLSFAGLLTYCLFPEAPPWMAARDGLSDPVTRLSPRGWLLMHVESLNDVLAKAQDVGSNAVAAMPSLHFAFSVLVAIAIGTSLRARWRYLLALYPVAMAFTLVYCGEHYVIDILAGLLYALAVHYAVTAWERRRAARAAAREFDLAAGDSHDREVAVR